MILPTISHRRRRTESFALEDIGFGNNFDADDTRGSSNRKPINASTTAIERFVIAKAYAVLIDDHLRANDATRDESELVGVRRSRSRSITAAQEFERDWMALFESRFLPERRNSPELVSHSRAAARP